MEAKWEPKSTESAVRAMPVFSSTASALAVTGGAAGAGDVSSTGSGSSASACAETAWQAGCDALRKTVDTAISWRRKSA